MTEKLFNSPELASFYRKEALDEVLHQLRKEINTKTLIGSGGDASVFGSADGRYVIKLCTKKIRYFKHFGKRGQATEFQKHINGLDPFFVPVEEIMYEDRNIFVYKQKRCDIITSQDIDLQVVVDVFRLVQFMLINDILLTDLAPHNLGLLDGHIVAFDYHGLHRLKKKGQIKRANWWKRVARNLTRFICAYCVPDKRKDYAKLMQNCNSSAVKKLENEKDLPRSFGRLIRYLLEHKNKASIDRIVDLLEQCISDLKGNKSSERSSHRRLTPVASSKKGDYGAESSDDDDDDDDDSEDSEDSHKKNKSKSHRH